MVEFKIFKSDKPKETILFLHGFLGGFDSFFGVYQHFLPKYQVILAKFNFAPATVATIYDYAFFVARFLKKQGIDKVHLITHSFGARVALVLTAKTNCVDRMVLAAPAGLRPRFSFKRWVKVRHYKLCRFCVQKGWMKPQRLSRFGSSDYKSLSPAGRQTFNNIVKKNLYDLLKYIKAPTLIYAGQKDKDVLPYMARKMHKGIWGSRLVWTPDGHFAYLEDPEAFKLLAEKFLAC